MVSMEPDRPAGKITFLHGPSSSGKSTLARGLQGAIEAPFWHISIDHLRDAGVLPRARFRSGEFDWSQSQQAIFDGYHRSLVAYARMGNNLILEHILEADHWLGDIAALFEPFDVFFVGVFCPLDELNRREQHRGDRPVGSAAQDFEQIHRGKIYDLELDDTLPVAQNVETLLKAWRARRSPLAFERVRERLHEQRTGMLA
jgi:chloramphenicol 3-O phosphotransferase